METQQQNEKCKVKNGQKVIFTKPQSKCWLFRGDTELGQKMKQFLDGLFFSILITVVTAISLFSDDIRQIFFPIEADLGFSILTIVCMVVYLFEMISLSILQEGYFLRYYFWLDLVSTLTMLLDLVWITELLSGGNGVQATASVARVARASRASKIGAKATKLIRIIRLIRILRLYKTASKRLEKQNITAKINEKIQKYPTIRQTKVSIGHIERSQSKRWTRIRQASQIFNFRSHRNNFQASINQLPGIKDDPAALRVISRKFMEKLNSPLPSINENFRSHQHHTLNFGYRNNYISQQIQCQQFANRSKQSHTIVNQKDISQNDVEVPMETKVGSKIKDQIQKNIISMILLILITIPIFNASTWFDRISSYQKVIKQLQYIAKNDPTAYDLQAGIYIQEMLNLPQKLVFFSVNVNDTCCQFPSDYPSYFDNYNIRNLSSLRSDEVNIFSDTSTVVFDAHQLRILSAQLNIGRTFFVCMLLVISTLLFSRDIETHALQPLENMLETVRKIAINPLNTIRDLEQKNMFLEGENINDDYQKTEPHILENMIVKIGSLLAVGFGQAGTQIISRVIEDNSYIDVMTPGQKVIAIFGFCDIRNFTDATQVLEADVMVFVNEIAEICHKVVYSHGGHPNKNIGDAFLLVWKFSQSDVKLPEVSAQSQEIQLVSSKKVKQTADLAVLSFVRMIAEISRAYSLLKYKNNKGLNQRIKNYEGVKMGFGMHVGWAIEGPIGSQYKIDASYLSPIVNISGQLQAATKQYGIPMLITGQVYDLMTENKKRMRHVDRVKIGKQQHLTDLYTVDIYIKNLLKMTGTDNYNELSDKQHKLNKLRINIDRRKLMEDIEGKYMTNNLWNHQDILYLTQPYSSVFFQSWSAGFKHYLKGNWETALDILRKTKLLAPNNSDGPCESLIRFIESYNNQSPSNWQGYRELGEEIKKIPKEKLVSNQKILIRSQAYEQLWNIYEHSDYENFLYSHKNDEKALPLPQSFNLIKIQSNISNNLMNIDFPILNQRVCDLVQLSTDIINNNGFIPSNFSLLHPLIEQIAFNYNVLPYHTFSHAFSLMLLLYQSLEIQPKFQKLFNSSELFYTYIAALAHDLNHQGTNNHYEIQRKTFLAIEAKNESVLQKMHLNQFWTILRQHPHLDCIGQQNYAAKQLIIKLILSTDISKHFSSFEELKKSQSIEDNRYFILQQLFHACDIGNPCLSYNNYISWSSLLSYQFNNQAVLQAEEGLEVTKIFLFQNLQTFYKGQLIFINNMVLPLWKQLSLHCPNFEKFVANINSNIKQLQYQCQE